MGETGLESLHWVFILTPLFPSHFWRTISGNVDGKKGNAPETHGTRNGTHGDVGKVDMCVLNSAPRNPGWKWGRGGCFINYHWVNARIQPNVVDRLYRFEFTIIQQNIIYFGCKKETQIKKKKESEKPKDFLTYKKHLDLFITGPNKAQPVGNNTTLLPLVRASLWQADCFFLPSSSPTLSPPRTEANRLSLFCIQLWWAKDKDLRVRGTRKLTQRSSPNQNQRRQRIQTRRGRRRACSRKRNLPLPLAPPPRGILSVSLVWNLEKAVTSASPKLILLSSAPRSLSGRETRFLLPSSLLWFWLSL